MDNIYERNNKNTNHVDNVLRLHRSDDHDPRNDSQVYLIINIDNNHV